MTTRALIYARQSDSSGAGADSLSLASQESALRARAEREGWAVVGVEKDADLRGWQEPADRPGLTAALARAAKREYTVLMVWEISRLARSLRIQENVLHDLSRHGVEVFSHQEPWVSAPLFRQLLGAIAEEQTRTISAHTRRAITARVRRGIPWGVVPYGYLRPEPAGPLVPCAEQSHIVRWLFTRYLDGAGVVQLATELTVRGEPTPRGYRIWREQTVARILDSRVYLGEAVINGEWIADAHPAIVDLALFAAVAALRGQRLRHPRQKAESSWLEGMIRHACGGRMYLMSGYRLTRPYYRCRQSSIHERSNQDNLHCPVARRTIAAWKAEDAVRIRLVSDLTHLRPVAEVVAVDRLNRAVDDLSAHRRRDVETRQRRARDRRTKAEELYLSGSRDRAWFDAQDAIISGELAAVDVDLAALPAPPDAVSRRLTARRLRSLSAAADVAGDDALRAILAELGTVIVGPAGVGIVYHPHAAPFFARSN